eukprot:scaffold3187_cov361-Prasinococcus_capsulatus_cf.AAC.8
MLAKLPHLWHGDAAEQLKSERTGGDQVAAEHKPGVLPLLRGVRRLMLCARGGLNHGGPAAGRSVCWRSCSGCGVVQAQQHATCASRCTRERPPRARARPGPPPDVRRRRAAPARFCARRVRPARRAAQAQAQPATRQTDVGALGRRAADQLATNLTNGRRYLPWHGCCD